MTKTNVSGCDGRCFKPCALKIPSCEMAWRGSVAQESWGLVGSDLLRRKGSRQEPGAETLCGRADAWSGSCVFSLGVGQVEIKLYGAD